MYTSVLSRKRRRRKRTEKSRKGAMLALAAFCLPVVLAFVAFAVDTGRMALVQVSLQNAVDAASLAASQEIVSAVQEAGEDGEYGDPTIDANSIAVANARQVAAEVAAANGVYIDPDQDVIFGKRVLDEQSGTWPIQWGAEPYNVVKVVARRDQANTALPDGRVRLLFGWAVGKPTVAMRASAAAFVEARDLVVVLDFSGSMSYDSQLRSSTISKLGMDALTANMQEIYEALGPPPAGSLTFEPQYLTLVGQPPAKPSQPQITVTFEGNSVYVESTKDLSNVVLGFDEGADYKFDNLNCGTSGRFENPYPDREIVTVWVKSGRNASGDGPGYGERFDDTNTAVKQAFGLDAVPYPYPSGSWDSLINHCRYDSDIRNAGYKKKYGGLCWVDYLLQKKRLHSQTPDLWKTPHYPFHAVKEGCTLFCNFLENLDFGDELGLVSYATTARWETTLNEDGYSIDISADPIIKEYSVIDTIQRHKQAAHYSPMTHMGDGILKAREMLAAHARFGARPTILLMTDGNTNQMPSGWSLPSGWNWADYTDYDGDGYADYVPSNTKKAYALWEAVQAANAGITIHTMSVGLTADKDIMEAVAFIGGGICIHVEGGSTIAEMEDQILQAFSQIASKVPPAKLVYDITSE